MQFCQTIMQFCQTIMQFYQTIMQFYQTIMQFYQTIMQLAPTGRYIPAGQRPGKVWLGFEPHRNGNISYPLNLLKMVAVLWWETAQNVAMPGEWPLVRVGCA